MSDHRNSTALPAISIAGVEITHDGEGRYNLNALHRASGAEKKDGPSYWLALESTQALISELDAQTTGNSVVTREGRNGGTFAHELLVVSYAGWISPSFQLKVNQAFLDMKAGLVGLPDFSNPAVAARAWADQVEARQIAERTKAEIGSRREATAMATASTATRRANALQRMLDKTGQYASVKRMEDHYKREFPWRPLTKASEDMGLPPVKVPDANYGKVNTYHADVWMKVYGVEIPESIASEGLV